MYSVGRRAFLEFVASMKKAGGDDMLRVDNVRSIAENTAWTLV
jgi:hypothetical protein